VGTRGFEGLQGAVTKQN